MIFRLIYPSAGQILFEGRDVWGSFRSDLWLFADEMQAIFQDPASSFNPRQSIGAILAAPSKCTTSERPLERAKDCGGNPRARWALRHLYVTTPINFPADQRQRVASLARSSSVPR